MLSTALLSLLILLQSNSPTAVVKVEDPPKLDWIVTRDIVLLGEIQAIDWDQREFESTCQREFDAPNGSVNLSIRIDDVVLGVSRELSIEFSVHDRRFTVGDDQMPGGVRVRSRQRFVAPIGSRVLVWGKRLCNDNWRIWGELAIVAENDTLISPWEGAADFGFEFSQFTRTLSDAVREIQANRALNGVEVFEGCQAAVLVEIGEHETLHMDGREFSKKSCTNLSIVRGRSTEVPSALVLDVSLHECPHSITMGDTLLVPIPAGFSGGNLIVTACPIPWKVVGGYVVGLDATVGDLDQVLKEDENGLVLRRNP